MNRDDFPPRYRPKNQLNDLHNLCESFDELGKRISQMLLGRAAELNEAVTHTENSYYNLVEKNFQLETEIKSLKAELAKLKEE